MPFWFFTFIYNLLFISVNSRTFFAPIVLKFQHKVSWIFLHPLYWAFNGPFNLKTHIRSVLGKFLALFFDNVLSMFSLFCFLRKLVKKKSPKLMSFFSFPLLHLCLCFLVSRRVPSTLSLTLNTPFLHFCYYSINFQELF